MLRKVVARVASGLFALGLLAGGLAFSPADHASAAYSKTLYTVYFNDGSGQGQALRQRCVNGAASYGAISASAQVTGHARQVNGVWQNRLDCIGTFAGFPFNDRVDLSNAGIFQP